jgi:hypothetical protein
MKNRKREICTSGSVPWFSERPDPPLSNRRVGTCHDATGVARHDRPDSYQKPERTRLLQANFCWKQDGRPQPRPPGEANRPHPLPDCWRSRGS